MQYRKMSMLEINLCQFYQYETKPNVKEHDVVYNKY